jgi:hypothetical protein
MYNATEEATGEKAVKQRHSRHTKMLVTEEIEK